MPARRNIRTYPSAEEVLPPDRMGPSMEEEPMRRYPHVITATASACQVRPGGEPEKAVELLTAQNQLLVDLLGAVNSLTAALLSREVRKD